MKLIAIKTKERVYISDNIESVGYFGSQIPVHKFDGCSAAKTYLSDWFELPAIPLVVEKKCADKYENIRWELKAGFPVSNLTPAILTENPSDEDSGYGDVSNLYSKKYETIPGGMEPITFQITIIAEEENFKIQRQDFPVSFGLLDRISLNPVLLPIKPCRIETKDFYRLIREHVKKHIDGRFARITSDYDFCFTVCKVIQLAEPKAYKTDVGTKHRPKVVTKFNHDKNVEIFEMAPAPYQGYTVIPPLVGKSYEDLQNNLKTFLDELMDNINKPVKECNTCKGTGVITD